ncbi:MAG: flagellar biosynthetic protein FliO [Epsilonproteobacteria bacterium]|nr:flagellar biosynthetic protein FliO [Campylobacterota bacterium]
MPEGYDYLKLIGAFGIVLVLLYGLYYYLHNLLGIGGARGKGRLIRIIETRVVGRNRSLILAEVDGFRLLLASDEEGLHLLKAWEKREHCSDTSQPSPS